MPLVEFFSNTNVVTASDAAPLPVSTPDAPARIHYAVTPSNTADLPYLPRALRVLTSGNLALRDAAGTVIIYPVTAGETIPFRAVRVMATGTTATVAGWE